MIGSCETHPHQYVGETSGCPSCFWEKVRVLEDERIRHVMAKVRFARLQEQQMDAVMALRNHVKSEGLDRVRKYKSYQERVYRGMQVGRWTVIGSPHKNGKKWDARVRCRCGKERALSCRILAKRGTDGCASRACKNPVKGAW